LYWLYEFLRVDMIFIHFVEEVVETMEGAALRKDS
jgi:hypothetical protein